MQVLSHTDTGGDKEALIFIHGIMASKDVWLYQIEELAKNNRVIAVDLSGFGQSPKWSDDPDNVFEKHAAEIVELMVQLDIERANIVGWSMGGVVSIVLAVLYSNYCKSLTLVDTTPKFAADDTFQHALSKENLEGLYSDLAAETEAAIKGFVGMAVPEPKADAERDILMNMAMSTDVQVTLDHLRHSMSLDLRSELAGINVPALVICGLLDTVCLPGASKVLAHELPHSQIELLEDTGHAPLLTVPRQFNAILHRFLDSH